MGKRVFALDIIRCIACFLVLVIHSPIAVHGENGFLFASMSMIGSPCIGLFFMVSGYLLLPTDKTLFPFLKKRMGRVLMPTLFWTAFYLLQIYASGEHFQGQSWITTILSIPFTRQGCGFLWFMYALAGLYVVAPIISNWVANAKKNEFQFVLGLWFLTTCNSLLHPFVVLPEDTYSMYYYFTGYAGYFLLGAYMKRFRPQVPSVLLVALYFVPFGIAFFAKFQNFEWIENSFGYLCFMTVLQTYALFLLVLKITPSPQIGQKSGLVSRTIISFSNCSFGIYLMHKFVMVDVIKGSGMFASLGVSLQLGLSIVTAALLAWGLTNAISYVPGAAYIVGFTNRKQK